MFLRFFYQINNRLIVKLGLVAIVLCSLFMLIKLRFILKFDHFSDKTRKEHRLQLYEEDTGTFRTILLGERKRQQALLTIGISSVHRDKGNYLLETLHHLITKSTPEEREDVTTVVCLSDPDASIRISTAENISRSFGPSIDSGFLLVIQTPPYVYPTLKNLRSTYGDPPERVSWRAKQAIDFSYLFNFSAGLSHYYMILEDDVTCLQGYLTEIKKQIGRETDGWLTLHFSSFLIIGMLFESQHLTHIAQFVQLFYAVQPVDFLVIRYFEMLVPGDERLNLLHRVPSIFQHIGYYSTLNDKVQPLMDEAFPGDVPELYVTNPSAQVLTTIRAYDRYSPHLAYSSNLSFFWGIPREGDTYDIVFREPMRISHVVVVTGLPATLDYLRHGVLMASPSFLKLIAPNQASCFQFETVAQFVRGRVNASNFARHVQCIRIMVTKPQKNWLIIRRIAVFRMASSLQNP